MKKYKKLLILLLIILIVVFIVSELLLAQNKEGKNNMNFEVKKTEAEWKQILTPEEYNVLREKGT